MAESDSHAYIFDGMRGGPNSERGSNALEPLLRARKQGTRTSEPRENCITSGSPLCRGLTRATYILCIEHPRPKRLSRESNPGPPALQANTLMQRAIRTALLTAIRNLGLHYYSFHLMWSANHKSANCCICRWSANLKKSANLRFAALICGPPTFDNIQCADINT